MKWKAGDIRLPDLRLRCRLLLYSVSIIFVALSMIDVIGNIFSEMVGPVLYALATCSLFASCYYLILDIKYGVMEKVKPRIQGNPFTNRVVRDYRYRTVVFAVAAYSFYKIIVAVINVVKARKLRSPILMTIRNIGYIDACVSILSLQTAMFASFGKHQPEFMKLMNALAGLAVCIMVLVMGIRCIYTAQKMKQELAGGIVHDSYTCSRR